MDDFDLNLDFNDSFGEFQIDKPKNGKHKVIAGVASNTTSALKAGSINISKNVSSSILNSMPVSSALIDDASMAKDQLANAYEDTKKEVMKAVIVGKKALAYALPKTKRYIPKKLYEKLEKFSTVEDDRVEQKKSDYEVAEETTGRQIGDIFKESGGFDKEQLEHQVAEKFISDIREAEFRKRVLAAMFKLNEKYTYGIRFMESTMFPFMRKNLEIGMMQLFMAKQQHGTLKIIAELLDKKLDAIITNTSLPEVAKIKLSDKFATSWRVQTMEAASRSLVDYAKKFVTKYKSNILDQVSQLTDMGGQGIDMLGQADELGFGDDEKGKTGKFVGGMIGNKISPIISRALLEPLKPFTRSIERDLGMVRSYIRSGARDVRETLSSSSNTLLQTLGQMMPITTPYVEIGNNLLTNVDEAVPFDKLTRQSIVEIIPKWLSRIATNTRNIFEGKETGEEVYNVVKRRITSIDEAKHDFMTYRVGDKSSRSQGIKEALGIVKGAIESNDLLDESHYEFSKNDLLRMIDNMVANNINLQKKKFAKYRYVTSEDDIDMNEMKIYLDGVKNPVALLRVIGNLIYHDGEYDNEFLSLMQRAIETETTKSSMRNEMPSDIEKYGFYSMFSDEIKDGRFTAEAMRKLRLNIDQQAMESGVEAGADMYKTYANAWKESVDTAHESSLVQAIPQSVRARADTIAAKNMFFVSPLAKLVGGNTEIIDEMAAKDILHNQYKKPEQKQEEKKHVPGQLTDILTKEKTIRLYTPNQEKLRKAGIEDIPEHELGALTKIKSGNVFKDMLAELIGIHKLLAERFGFDVWVPREKEEQPTLDTDQINIEPVNPLRPATSKKRKARRSRAQRVIEPDDIKLDMDVDTEQINEEVPHLSKSTKRKKRRKYVVEEETPKSARERISDTLKNVKESAMTETKKIKSNIQSASERIQPHVKQATETLKQHKEKAVEKSTPYIEKVVDTVTPHIKLAEEYIDKHVDTLKKRYMPIIDKGVATIKPYVDTAATVVDSNLENIKKKLYGHKDVTVAGARGMRIGVTAEAMPDRTDNLVELIRANRNAAKERIGKSEIEISGDAIKRVIEQSRASSEKVKKEMLKTDSSKETIVDKLKSNGYIDSGIASLKSKQDDANRIIGRLKHELSELNAKLFKKKEKENAEKEDSRISKIVEKVTSKFKDSKEQGGIFGATPAEGISSDTGWLEQIHAAIVECCNNQLEALEVLTKAVITSGSGSGDISQVIVDRPHLFSKLIKTTGSVSKKAIGTYGAITKQFYKGMFGAGKAIIPGLAKGIGGVAKGIGHAAGGTATGIGKAMPALQKMASAYLGTVGKIYGGAFKAVGTIGKAMFKPPKAGGSEEEPFVDVYRKGEVDAGNPLAKASDLREYGIKASGAKLSSCADIDGPILNSKTEQTIISKEDFEHGLVDVNGKSIFASKSILGKIGKFAKGLKHQGGLLGMAARVFDTGGSALKMMKPLVGNIAKFYGKFYGNAISGIGKGIGNSLGWIFGNRGGKLKVKGGVSKLLDPVTMRLDRIYRFMIKTWGTADDMKDILADKLPTKDEVKTTIKERLVDLKKKAKDKLHKFMDKDGDGDRDGSSEDIMDKYRKRAKDSFAKLKVWRKTKKPKDIDSTEDLEPESNSLWSKAKSVTSVAGGAWLLNKVKGLFGKGKPETANQSLLGRVKGMFSRTKTPKVASSSKGLLGKTGSLLKSAGGKVGSLFKSAGGAIKNSKLLGSAASKAGSLFRGAGTVGSRLGAIAPAMTSAGGGMLSTAGSVLGKAVPWVTAGMALYGGVKGLAADHEARAKEWESFKDKSFLGKAGAVINPVNWGKWTGMGLRSGGEKIVDSVGKIKDTARNVGKFAYKYSPLGLGVSAIKGIKHMFNRPKTKEENDQQTQLNEEHPIQEQPHVSRAGKLFEGAKKVGKFAYKYSPLGLNTHLIKGIRNRFFKKHEDEREPVDKSAVASAANKLDLNNTDLITPFAANRNSVGIVNNSGMAKDFAIKESIAKVGKVTPLIVNSATTGIAYHKNTKQVAQDLLKKRSLQHEDKTKVLKIKPIAVEEPKKHGAITDRKIDNKYLSAITENTENIVKNTEASVKAMDDMVKYLEKLLGINEDMRGSFDKVAENTEKLNEMNKHLAKNKDKENKVIVMNNGSENKPAPTISTPIISVVKNRVVYS